VSKLQTLTATSVNARIVFWPCLVDMLTSVLMIFLLVYFIQATLGQKDLEAQLIRRNQEKFISVFRQEFAGELGEKKVAIKQDLNLIQITFSDQILFDSKAYKLKPEGEKNLRRCAVIFNKSIQSGFKQVQVEGHTDNRNFESFDYPHDNWELSTGRAISVVKFLVGQGLKEGLLSANGYAANKPIDPQDTEKAWSKNRRIEIRIIFSTPDGQR
jgi:chemotaxis protein MotB